MEHKGIRYTIRARIERGEWFVAIHPDDVEMPGKIVSGGREQAETLAHLMIKNGSIDEVRDPQQASPKPSICTRIFPSESVSANK